MEIDCLPNRFLFVEFLQVHPTKQNFKYSLQLNDEPGPWMRRRPSTAAMMKAPAFINHPDSPETTDTNLSDIYVLGVGETKYNKQGQRRGGSSNWYAGFGIMINTKHIQKITMTMMLNHIDKLHDFCMVLFPV